MGKDDLYQKRGVVIRAIAAELLTLNIHDRMPIISDFQKEYSISRGTVQNAIAFLKENQAIQTESRGHLGTYITDINYAILQDYAFANQLSATMPLPYSKLYEGLATGLYLTFKSYNIKLNMAYIRGSEDRIQAVEQGIYHFAVVSKYAAEKAVDSDAKIKVVMEFGNRSYLSKHILLLANDASTLEDGMRVGIDHDSLDQQELTNFLIQGKNVELVEMPSNQLIYALQENQIDAGVWNYDEIVERNYKDINYQAIPTSRKFEGMTEAVIICQDGNQLIETIIRKYISIVTLLDIQKQVKEGKMTPRY
ncbi:hypothetical protein AT268_12320 [Bacillus cereus]|uniref:GntR family transcriptional regulator n=1 Tax=Bacillus cereus TaxID=1396 RepID=A0A9X0MHY5_BACCE|nr:GntR family transcriptional regulator YhfZ [Bacillus cereus]KXY46247.1 hypothetical protein AT268_12320 [Bacillus cereus]HDR5276902.1 hypothetical protein [Bacillus thuringiensis]